MTKSQEWDRREKELSEPNPKNLTNFKPNQKCDHGHLVTNGQCLLCLFGDEYNNTEELR